MQIKNKIKATRIIERITKITLIFINKFSPSSQHTTRNSSPHKIHKPAIKPALLLISALSFLTIASPPHVIGNSADVEIPEQKISQELFNQVVDQIRNNYYSLVEDTKLFEGAIRGMLSSLDPYSTYLSPKEYAEMKKSTAGEFSGIGIDIMPPDGNGTLRVISPYEGGPAFRAGMKPGDLIVEINGTEVADIPPENVIDYLRGNTGSRVQIKVIREGNQILEFNIIRESIKIIPVQIKILPNTRTIYIKIRAFNGITDKIIKRELEKIFHKIKEQKPNITLDGAIIDLRSNPGGLLEQAISVSEIFLPKNKTIVFINNKNDRGNKEKVAEQKYETSKDPIFPLDLPMVTLINEGCASAGEIVAAALKDNGRSILVGEKSFGKASVQVVIPIANGGAIKLSTATYYTPKGEMIHGKGITPDIHVNSQGHVLDNKSLQNINKKDITTGKNSTEANLVTTDPQLSKSYELLQLMIFYKKNL